MNKFLPIRNKKVGIIGFGSSGKSAANLALMFGANVFVTDSNIKNKVKLKDVEVEFGKHSNKVLKSDFIIKSPGVPQNINILNKAKKLSIPIISEIEFASWFTKLDIICLTGTNGKTTTVNLINEILNNNKISTYLGGNVGTPFSKNVLAELQDKKNKKKDFQLLELSSFQLEDIIYFKPKISIILNLKPDHMDRYKNFNEYKNTKLNILRNQNETCLSIINQNINVSNDIIKSKIVNFKVEDSKIIINEEIQNFNLKNYNLRGSHNLENIAASKIVANFLKISNDNIDKSINSFLPLKHRCEKLKINSDKNFYNDSKATNLPATIAAIDSISKNIILILGGKDKNKSDFSILQKYKNHIKCIISYGESRFLIKNKLNEFFTVYVNLNFSNAVLKSIKISNSHDNILLSPACASYDQFNSYEERGDDFKKIIRKYYDK